jgi:anaphase-promoting complex subunit 6
MTLSKISKRIPQKKSFKPVQDQVNVLVEQIRTWRDDAFYQRLYPSALFWGEKIVSMTGYQEPMDIYYLAQIYYLNQEYLQCKELLSRKHLSFSSLWCKLLAAQCCIKLELWEETLELLGESTGFQSQQALDVRLSNQHGRGIQIEASLYQLRGIAYLNQGLKQRAKEELLEALRIDPHCYDALQTLLDNYMLTTNEEGELLQGLSFDGMPAFEAEFIKALYLSKVSPLGKMDIITQVHDTLLDTYHLSSCPLVLIGKAEVAMVQFDYEKASSTLQSYLKLT